MRALADYIMRGRLQAMLVALACSSIPLLGWLGLVVMALVTLRKGAQEGFYILCVTLLPSFGLMWAGQISHALWYYVLLSNCLVWVAATLLYHTHEWSMVLQLTAGLCVLLVLGIHLVYPDVTAIWLQLLSKAVAQLKANSSLAGNLEPEQLQAIVGIGAKFATGIQISFMMLNSWFNLLLARWWQANLYNPGGLRKELLNLHLTKIATLILLVVVLLVLTNNAGACDILPILLLPFFLAGLSLAHSTMILLKHKLLYIVALYAMLFFMLPQIFLLLVFLAWLDVWFNFRGRMVRITS